MDNRTMTGSMGRQYWVNYYASLVVTRFAFGADLEELTPFIEKLEIALCSLEDS